MVDGNSIFDERGLFDDDVRGEDDDGPLVRPSTPKQLKKKSGKVLYYLETKYDLVQELCESNEGWKEINSIDDDFDLFWCDTVMAADRFIKMKPYQRVNHFLGMSAISRKNNLGRNLLRMKKHFPKEYRFFPDTWILPTDLSDFKAQFTGKKNKTFIVKPDNGCQGKGIFLTRDFEKIPIDYSTTLVAQRYIHKPYLLDGFKFDLRLYVLVTGCDPLRVYMHREGLVRLATIEYTPPSGKNMKREMMHLTNYAVNCKNPEFEQNEDPDDIHDGHKRSLRALWEHLASEGHDVQALQEEIDDMILKTLVAVQPSLAHVYHSCQPDDVENSMCFEVLGVDIMLDHKLKPWLLEVNHAPSFGTDSELDQRVKEQVLQDTLTMMAFSAERKKTFKRESKKFAALRQLGREKGQKEKRRPGRMDLRELREILSKALAAEESNPGAYRKLYPTEEQELKYLPYHDVAVDIWETLTGAQSRKPVRMFTPIEEKEDPEEKKPKEEKKPLKKPTETTKRWQAAANRGRDVGGVNKREAIEPRGSKDSVHSMPLEASGNDSAEDAELTPAIEMEPEAEKDHSDPGPKPGRRARISANPGDVVKVQTNMGWEWVTVLSKYPDGRTDIQFVDGEVMHRVYPRILRASQSEGRPPFPESASEAEPSNTATAKLAATSVAAVKASPVIGQLATAMAPALVEAHSLITNVAAAGGGIARAHPATARLSKPPQRPGSGSRLAAFERASTGSTTVSSGGDDPRSSATPPAAARRATPTPPPSARNGKRPFANCVSQAVSALRQQADETEVAGSTVAGSGGRTSRSGGAIGSSAASSGVDLPPGVRTAADPHVGGAGQLQSLMEIRSLGTRKTVPSNSFSGFTSGTRQRAGRSISSDGLRTR